MTRILLVGGAGFIGARTAQQLAADGCRVALFDFESVESGTATHWRQWRLERQANAADLYWGDIRDGDVIVNACLDFAPEVIIHLAAVSEAGVCERDSAYADAVHIGGTRSVLDAAVCCGARRVILISTSFVYGDFEYVPADECHPLHPVGVYGRTKREAEILVEKACRRDGIEFVICRPSAVYGYGDSHKRVVNLFIQSALSGQPMTLVDDGAERLDFSYVDDVASGICLAALHQAAANEAFNITCGEGRTIAELAQTIQAQIPEATVAVQASGAEMRRPKRGALDISKARTMLGYHPRFSLEDGIAAFLRDIREHGLP